MSAVAPEPHTAPMCGLVLAAGAGTRFGGPKGLARQPDGAPWVGLAVDMLRRAGCRDVLVAVGADADAVAALVPAGARVVPVPHWRDGVSASLRAGLAAAAETDAEVLVITVVDTPAAASAAVVRVLDACGRDAGALGQAVYRGDPGHPVVVGRDSWEPLAAAVSGDRGARAYLVAHGVLEVECGDLWSGADVDVPAS